MSSLGTAGILLLLPTSVLCQHAGTAKDNYLLPLPVDKCTKAGGCTSEKTTASMDANWRWIHSHNGYTNCYTGEKWNQSACADNKACAKSCALEGIPQDQWSETYGIHTMEGGVKLDFKTGDNIGSRFYLLDTPDTYKLFKLNNREFTFDVDVSKLACGLNGAVYFSEMPADGGMTATNSAGAAYGTGYCDAQCPRDVKFIEGEANAEGWHLTDSGRTFGDYGSCCAELDIWEANRVANAFTLHPCSVDKLYRCKQEDGECDDVCDKSGCDFNSFRMGNETFFGPGDKYTVNTEKPYTLVTQFITVDGTDEGDLKEMKRFYIQDGKKIEDPRATWSGLDGQTSLTDASCAKDKAVFGDEDTFKQFGGMKKMGEAMARGMTLVLSLWDDTDDHMKWLDSADPAGADPSKPGVRRGPCSPSSGSPSDVRSQNPDAWVKYFNIKYGEIGSTVDALSSSSPSAPTPSSKPASGSGDSCCWDGCGGATCKTNIFCSSSESECKNCGGEFCPAPSCCWDGCGGSTCKSGIFCSESEGSCRKCGGTYCPAAASLLDAKRDVKPHSRGQKQLRGQVLRADHALMQMKRIRLDRPQRAKPAEELRAEEL